MSTERLSAIRSRLEAATSGPWSSMTEETADGENIYYTVEGKDESGRNYMIADLVNTSLQGSHDAEFMSEARQDIPWLLERLAAVKSLHNSDGMQWVGFPRADRQERYCTACQKTAPCPTIRALENVA